MNKKFLIIVLILFTVVILFIGSTANNPCDDVKSKFNNYNGRYWYSLKEGNAQWSPQDPSFQFSYESNHLYKVETPYSWFDYNFIRISNSDGKIGWANVRNGCYINN